MFTNGTADKYHTAIESSMMAGPDNGGDVIVISPVTVFAENKKVAVIGAATAQGYAVSSASTNVFAGDNGPAAETVIENDDIDDGTAAGHSAVTAHLVTQVRAGVLDKAVVARSLSVSAVTTDSSPAKTIVGTTQACGQIHSMTAWPMTLKISKHFTLGNLLNRWVDGKLIDYPNHELQANKGFSIDQIVCNLSLLCQNVLDPLYEKYPDWTVTNSFREGAGKQHANGQACDLKLNVRDTRAHFARAQWIRDHLPYDQLLLEYRDSMVHGHPYVQNWIHISFVGESVYRNTNGSGPQGCRSASELNKIGTLYNDIWKANYLQLY